MLTAQGDLPSSPLSPVPSYIDSITSTENEEPIDLHHSKLGDLPLVPQTAMLTEETDSVEETVPTNIPPSISTIPVIDPQIQNSNTEEATSASSLSTAISLSTEDQLAVPSARSTRNRKAPLRFIEGFEVKPKTPKKIPSRIPAQVSGITPTATKRKAQPQRGNLSSHYLLSNSNSKLANCNLLDLLSNEKAWSVLTRAEQLELISMLPGVLVPSLPEATPLPNIMKQHLKSNNSFQADVRLFGEDLAAGRYEPKWLEDAQNATNKRAKGHFDDWKENNRESFWGQKQRVDWSALAGESSQHSLQTLVGAGYFMVGDVWLLRRYFRGESSGSLVEKEAVIAHVTSENLLTFTFPRGQHKLSSTLNGTDVVLHDVNGPTPLSNAMLAEDGRLVGVRAANAWKDIRCFRKNQDMGSLWDIRELYHRRNYSEKQK